MIDSIIFSDADGAVVDAWGEGTGAIFHGHARHQLLRRRVARRAGIAESGRGRRAPLIGQKQLRAKLADFSLQNRTQSDRIIVILGVYLKTFNFNHKANKHLKLSMKTIEDIILKTNINLSTNRIFAPFSLVVWFRPITEEYFTNFEHNHSTRPDCTKGRLIDIATNNKRNKFFL